jgi:hypothetical protein
LKENPEAPNRKSEKAMEKKAMSLIHKEAFSTIEKRKIPSHIHIEDASTNPNSLSDNHGKRDTQCALCNQQFTSEVIQTEISLCPACSRHFAALSDHRIKSLISYWLRNSRSSEPSNACRETRLAS